MRQIIRFACCLLGMSWVSATWAATDAATALPHLLNYHGQLTDGGGTPLAGPVALQLRITDEAHAPLYVEDQTVTAFAGAVSVVVGNGTDPASGAVLGGIPPEVFTPGATRLLEVWVDGELRDDPAEIVSVPYAYWSETALRVAPGGITTDQLATTFVEEFAPQLVASPAYQEALAKVDSAATIGVNATFAYSAATSLQGVLEDFDNAIKAREMKNVDKAGDTMVGKLTIEKGGLEVVGDIAVSGKVDGVDVSDGATAMQSHIDAPSAHGADGAVVGMNTLNSTVSGLSTSIDNLTTTTNTLTTTTNQQTTALGALGTSVSGLQSDSTSVNKKIDGHILNSVAHGSDGSIIGANTLANSLSPLNQAIDNLSTNLAQKMDVETGATKTFVEDKIAAIPPAPTPAESAKPAITSGVVESASPVGVAMPGELAPNKCHWTYGYAGGSIGPYITLKGELNANNQLELSCMACNAVLCSGGNAGPCRVSYLIVCQP